MSKFRPATAPSLDRARVNDIAPYGRDFVGDVEVTADLDQIGRTYGWRALTNKSGVSKYMDGLVVIRVVRKEKKPC